MQFTQGWRCIIAAQYGAALLLCSSCATLSGFPDDPKSVNYAGGPSKSIGEAEIEAMRRIHGSNQDRMNMTVLDYRNSFVNSELVAIDDAFTQFLQKVRTQRASFSIITAGAVLSLNGLAATTGTAATKAALAAASAGILGQKGAVDQELFNAETLAVLISRMKAARLAALVPIKAGLTQDEKAYPIEAAFVQLHAYRDAGNLLSTLDEIATDSGVAASAAKTQIAMVTRDAVYRDSRAQIAIIEGRVSKLSDAAAIQLVFLMQRHLAERPQDFQDDLRDENPSQSRFRDATVARAFLQYWLEQEGGSSSEIKEWNDALMAVGG
jgi:hypothetical protein